MSDQVRYTAEQVRAGLDFNLRYNEGAQFAGDTLIDEFTKIAVDHSPEHGVYSCDFERAVWGEELEVGCVEDASLDVVAERLAARLNREPALAGMA